MAFGDFTVDRNSTKYVLGSGGTIVPVATDEPAIEFNADGSYKGLLVEPAATNLCLQSENFATTWSAAELTITANDTTAPDGNSTADRLADNANNNRHRIYQSGLSFTSGTTYTYSVFVKKDSSSRFLLLNAQFPFNAKCALNLDTLAITNLLGTGSVEDYGNGWYRFAITGTATSDNTDNIFLQMQDSASDVAYVGDGSSFFVWGAQVETGPIATSYIPTASAAVTRVKDDITQTGTQSLIGQTEGTLYIEVDWRASDVNQFLLELSDNSSLNRIRIDNRTGDDLRMFVRADATIILDQGESSSAYSGIQKIAFAYAEDDFELYRNGSSIKTFTSGSLAALSTLTDIDLGQAYNKNFQANMHIRAVAIYPTRLGTVELEVLTGAPTYGSYALMASSLGYTVE